MIIQIIQKQKLLRAHNEIDQPVFQSSWKKNVKRHANDKEVCNFKIITLRKQETFNEHVNML